MTRSDWDDDRVAAAFHARFDRPAPPTIGRDIHVRIAGTAPSRFGRPRPRPVWAIPAVAFAVLLLATIGIGLGGDIRPGGGIGPGGREDSPGTGASTSVAVGSDAAPPPAGAPEPPDEVLGLRVRSVSAAVAIRDAGQDDQAIAVRGWFTPPRLVSCGPAPTAEPDSPVQPRCPDEITWLTEDAESLVHVTGDRTEGDRPNGPALNPELDGMDASWWPDLPEPGRDGGSTPANVVFIGHFDDRRASLCSDEDLEGCRDRFVVDQVAWVRGVSLATSVVREVAQADPGVGSTNAQIEAMVANEAPGDTILSMVVTDGPEGLVKKEPSLADGQQGLRDQPVVWIVRVLEGDHVVTYVIVDGTEQIYELTSEGEAVDVGGSSPQPPSSVDSPGPWPPSGAAVVVLTSPVGAGEPPVQVAIVDESGRLTGFGEKSDVDPTTQPFDGRFAAFAEPGEPGRVHLRWIGGICDSHIVVTVDREIRSITFDMGPPVDCDSIGVGRELVLDFSGSVDVPAIEVREAG